MTTIFKEDQEAGLRCGMNDLGRLFLGDTRHGICLYVMADTPENREKLLADFDYSVDQRKQRQEPPKKMQPPEWQDADYKFQVNAAHVKAIYDDMEAKLRKFGRRTPGHGLDVPSFLSGVSSALYIISANYNRVADWCHIQEVDRHYFDQDE